MQRIEIHLSEPSYSIITMPVLLRSLIVKTPTTIHDYKAAFLKRSQVLKCLLLVLIGRPITVHSYDGCTGTLVMYTRGVLHVTGVSVTPGYSGNETDGTDGDTR